MEPEEKRIDDDEMDQVIGGANDPVETLEGPAVYELSNMKNKLAPNHMLAGDISDQH